MLACMAQMCAEEGPGSIVWKSKVVETTQCLPVGARLNQSMTSVEPIQTVFREHDTHVYGGYGAALGCMRNDGVECRWAAS